MGNGKKLVIVAAAALALLMACGKKADETMVSGEMAVPEMSSEELLASSLEYLLLDDSQEQQDLQEQETESGEPAQSGEPAGSTESGNGVQTDARQEPEEEQGETAVIYYGSGGSSGLKEETVVLPEMTPEELIGALARHNIVSLDTKVISFEKVQEDDRTALYLNLSKAAGEYLRTMSVEAECIIIASIASTFVENCDVDAVYFKVEGETLATSNAEYAQAVGRCTPEELMKALEEPGAGVGQDADTMQGAGQDADTAQEAGTGQDAGVMQGAGAGQDTGAAREMDPAQGQDAKTGAEDSEEGPNQDQESGSADGTQGKLPLVQKKN